MFKLGWLIEENTCRKLHQQTRERATVKGILGLACSSLSCCLPVRQLDLPGFCSASLILIFYIFSRAEARAIICAQQTCMSIESFWRSLGFFIARKMANLEHPILEFVSGSQKITLSTSKEGICVSVVSRHRKHILRCAIWMGQVCQAHGLGHIINTFTNLCTFDYMLLLFLALFVKLHV